ncbi:hypothetical protein BH11MYX3_BH11MYX3_15740 [soil metagenome]
MRRIVCGIALLVGGCTSDTGGDVTGPYSGELRRFGVDRITLPSTTSLQNEFADDLNGDGEPDNQLGLIVAALTQTNDTNKHVPDMIAARSIESFVELQANDLDHDTSVGARFVGDDMLSSDQIGGRLEHGAFASNRTRTVKVTGGAEVLLPVFADADPLTVTLLGAELDLGPDGAGGYDGVVRGGIPIAQARVIAYAGVLQMMRTRPTSHLVFARILDTNRDGVIAQSELESSSLLAGFIVDDIAIGDEPVLSVGFGFHMCDTASCALAPPVDACSDRKRDGSETDIDCGGGACATCAAGLTCSGPADCETGGCDGGTCRAPTCSDGFRDGFESDVDCGAACRACDTGKHCANGMDCASGRCNSTVGSSGTCAP